MWSFLASERSERQAGSDLLAVRHRQVSNLWFEPLATKKLGIIPVFFWWVAGGSYEGFLGRKHEWPSRNTHLPAPTRTVRGSLSIILQPSCEAMLKVATNSPTECELRLVAKRKNKRKSDAFQTCFENEQKRSFFFWWVAGGSNPGPFD